MKKQILKIAGVKSEKEFYKKFPTEEAFMAKHGKELKKAQIGTYMTSQAEMPVYSPADIRGMYDELEYQLTGMTGSDRQKLEAISGIASEYGIDPAQLETFSEEILNDAPPAKRGKKIKKAQGGTSTQPEPNIGDPCCPDYGSWQAAHALWQQGQRYDAQGGGSGIAAPTTGGGIASGNIPGATTNTAAKSATDATKSKVDNTGAYVQSGIDVIQGLSMIKDQQNAVREAKQTSALTNAMGLAAASVPAQPIRRQYVRPEDVIIQPDQLYPSYGVGTNVLAEFGASVGGGEIMNTYAPNTLYDNLGYEPLNDSERYKQFYRGGKLQKAEGGFDFTNFMNNQGGNALAGTLGNVITGSEVEAGNKIGKGIGTAAGTAIGGPIGGAIGGLLGSAVGGIIDRSEEKIKKYQAESKRNMGDIMGRNFGMGIQSQFASFMEKGGYIPKAQGGTKKEKDLTKKDGECRAEVARDKEYSQLSKASAAADKAGEIAAKQEAKQIAAQQRADYADYINERLTGYGDKMKQKDFDAAYQAFAAQNPELAKDRLLYTVASKELPKLRSKDYYLRSKLSRIDPQLGYDTLTLPTLMQTMQKGFGGSQGYLEAWNRGFPQQEDGGTTSPYAWMSHTWQPQKIVSFGGHNLKDLLKPPHDADMLRAGGHLKAYTPPSDRAMSTERPIMQMGGELQTHWGGYAEPMSYNPFLPDGGETIMFRGQSHDESDGRGNTGIGITYGENPVEVERGEPAIKLKDGTGTDSSLVVFGNLKIPKAYVPMLGKEAQGKKFKTYVADLSKKENKQNKKIDNATKMLEDLEVSTPIDKMTLNSLQYTMLGANSKLKDIADKKMTAASLQNAINDTAEEMGLVADDLARGKVKIDKEAFKDTAQGGKKLKKVSALPNVPAGQQKGDVFYGNVTQADFEAMMARNPWYDWENFDPSSDADVRDFQKAFNREAKKLGVDTRLQVDGDFGEQTVSAESLYGNAPSATPRQLNLTQLGAQPSATVVSSNVQIPDYKRNSLMDVFGQVMPYLRPSDTEALDPRQLTGEMYALSTNQVEPVQAQTIQPQLDVPYDISLQDILNENEAAFRSQQRMIGYNPAFQSQLNAQKYAANAKVLGEQFRMNQAKRAEVYDRNRNLLNQYGLRSLDIFDRQYVRQAEALSKTKATTQAALNSIGSKFLQNRLENRTLATMENLYNYRFDPRFRAVNVNAPYQPVIPTVYIGPDGKQYQVVNNNPPFQPNIPNVSQGRVPAAAPAAAPVALSNVEPAPGTVGPPADDFSPVTPTNLQSAPIDFEQDMLTEDELKGYGKKGIKVGKKKGLNSSIVRAFKNL